MARRGYAETSVPEIARTAGLTPGLLHYHFRSKKEILLALIEHVEGILRTRIELRLSRTEGPGERLRAALDAHVALGPDANPDAVACWVQVGAEALRDADVRGVYERALKKQLAMLEELVEEALREEGRSTRKLRELASCLLAAIQGAYQVGVSSPGTIPRGATAPLLRHMAEGLLAAQPRVTAKGAES
jgi:TetR/AcrR family transcriptional repressor of bet genes